VSVQTLLRESATEGGRKVLVSSPDADEICRRLSSLLPKSELIGVAGLPDGIDELARAF
jgi:hypothetical protein